MQIKYQCKKTAFTYLFLYSSNAPLLLTRRYNDAFDSASYGRIIIYYHLLSLDYFKWKKIT